jgi:hypothetical protein
MYFGSCLIDVHGQLRGYLSIYSMCWVQALSPYIPCAGLKRYVLLNASDGMLCNMFYLSTLAKGVVVHVLVVLDISLSIIICVLIALQQNQKPTAKNQM